MNPGETEAMLQRLESLPEAERSEILRGLPTADVEAITSLASQRHAHSLESAEFARDLSGKYIRAFERGDEETMEAIREVMDLHISNNPKLNEALEAKQRTTTPEENREILRRSWEDATGHGPPRGE
jgi:hypothetical protein